MKPALVILALAWLALRGYLVGMALVFVWITTTWAIKGLPFVNPALAFLRRLFL